MTNKQKRALKRQAKRYFACPIKYCAKDPKDWPQAIILTLLLDNYMKERAK